MGERYRDNWLEIDRSAVEHNASLIAGLVAPAALCAVVKADAYGHGAAEVGPAALSGGASWLAVALVEEALALRRAGLEGRILLLSEPSNEGLEAALQAGVTPTLYTLPGVSGAATAARRLLEDRNGGSASAAGRAPIAVQLKLDTGMHRVGADAAELPAVARAVAGSGSIRAEALWSHLALAEDTASQVTSRQLERLMQARRALAGEGLAPPLAHLANSAGAIAHPATRLDLVRCGIALYGYSPVPEDRLGLLPVLSWKARVHLVRRLPAGERVSYGLRRPLGSDSLVAVVPAGYHDGVPRRLFEGGGEVLIGGRRRPIAGVVTMDQLIVDCGPAGDVRAGDEVVLIGRQGSDEISAQDWARWLGTISWEVLCGIGPRVPRVHVGAGRAGADPGASRAGADPGAGRGER